MPLLTGCHHYHAQKHHKTRASSRREERPRETSRGQISFELSWRSACHGSCLSVRTAPAKLPDIKRHGSKELFQQSRASRSQIRIKGLGYLYCIFHYNDCARRQRKNKFGFFRTQSPPTRRLTGRYIPPTFTWCRMSPFALKAARAKIHLDRSKTDWDRPPWRARTASHYLCMKPAKVDGDRVRHAAPSVPWTALVLQSRHGNPSRPATHRACHPPIKLHFNWL